MQSLDPVTTNLSHCGSIRWFLYDRKVFNNNLIVLIEKTVVLVDS